MHDYLQPLVPLFEQHADAANAVKMAQYLRDQFPFYGLRAPQRRALFKQFWSENGRPRPADLDTIIRDLWALPQREYQYTGLDILDKMHRHLKPESIQLLEHLITTKSWWDTIDGLASHAVGYLFAHYPEVRAATLPTWRTADDFWLRRTVLLFQLGYKEETDVPLLFSLIQENLDSKEFFIQKAIGWALREYSKTDADTVIQFVADTPLATLSRNEALKWLKRQE